jgi:hypothetical protein
MMLVRLPGASGDESTATFGRMFEHLRREPSIRAVAGSTYIPMRGTVSTVAVTVGDVTANVSGAAITPGYLDILKIPMRAGRSFSDEDTAGSMPVAIVNDMLARRLRPDGDVLGARIRAVPPRRGKVPAVEWTIRRHHGQHAQLRIESAIDTRVLRTVCAESGSAPACHRRDRVTPGRRGRGVWSRHARDST